MSWAFIISEHNGLRLDQLNMSQVGGHYRGERKGLVQTIISCQLCFDFLSRKLSLFLIISIRLSENDIKVGWGFLKLLFNHCIIGVSYQIIKIISITL